MSISIVSNPSFAYSSIRAGSIVGQATLSGDPETIAAATSAKPNAHPANLTGKLSSLEHAATDNIRPMFLKGVLQKVAGVKVRDLEISELDYSRSSVTLDAALASVQEDTGQTYELLHLDSAGMSLGAQGTFQTKAGGELSFDLQLSSNTISAAYAALSYQANAVTDPTVPEPEPSEPAAPESVDVVV